MSDPTQRELWAAEITDKVIDLNQRLHVVEIESAILRALIVNVAKTTGMTKEQFMEITAESVACAMELEDDMKDADKETAKILQGIFKNQGDSNVH